MKTAVPASLIGVFSLLVCAVSADGQTIIAIQDFESTPATPTWSFTNTGGASNAAAAESGLSGFRINNGVATLNFSPIDTTGLLNIILSLDLQSPSIVSNGHEASDSVTISISNDGLTFSDELKVTGAGTSNARWTYSNVVAVSPYDGNNSPLVFAPAGGGSRDDDGDGFSALSISGLPAVPQLFVRITMSNNNTNENWDIDNVRLSAIPEPSTYAAIFGAVSLGIVLVRRRLRRGDS